MDWGTLWGDWYNGTREMMGSWMWWLDEKRLDSILSPYIHALNWGWSDFSKTPTFLVVLALNYSVIPHLFWINYSLLKIPGLVPAYLYRCLFTVHHLPEVLTLLNWLVWFFAVLYFMFIECPLYSLGPGSLFLGACLHPPLPKILVSL